MDQREKNACKWTVIGLVVCAFLEVDFITGRVRADYYDFYYPHFTWTHLILIGICLGQIGLISTWVALAQRKLVSRFAGAILLTFLMWLSLVLGIRSGWQHYSLGEGFVLGLCLLGGTAIVQIPLWIARIAFRWRLVSWGSQEGLPPKERLQFHLRHVVLGMLLLSVTMALVRWAFPRIGVATVSGLTYELSGLLDYDLCAWLAPVVFGSLLITFPAVWSAFQKPTIIVVLVLGWSVYCALIAEIQFLVLAEFYGARRMADVSLEAGYVLNLSHVAAVFGTLVIFRALGFRLLRGPAAVPPAPGTGKSEL